ncbi:helix-turn-helix domain-containing protein [Amycolatopsis sp. CA-230715]|uniref:helix-turn-helix domain-containing protein n=1 Tax=Amycolatopsis sp. CA-230715 TaxID=2745196 RepID=UPI001C00A74C|nr:helix-turn-helix transcriptional regulator [Amycolatopsis sp. CA-230715]QWF82153.1 hypothetical protein HUW46_05590 [Amycolatopsis sp. CA-230715]
MGDQAELGAFLKSRRAALDPGDLGLPTGLNQRRVAGLRREELAQLAGISVDYYTRLEQGRARNVSSAVLDALSRALGLSTDEDTYLRNLATPRKRSAPAVKPQRVRPELAAMLDSLAVPAFVAGRCLDVLAWNRLCGALTFDFANLSPRERNIPRLFFLTELGRQTHPDFDAVTKEIVANLRADAGRTPDDPQLAQLIGELSMRSETFRKLWARHFVKEKAHGVKRMINPIVGELSLHYETLRLPDDPTQALVIYTAPRGSESERALNLLASWVAEHPADAPSRNSIAAES